MNRTASTILVFGLLVAGSAHADGNKTVNLVCHVDSKTQLKGGPQDGRTLDLQMTVTTGRANALPFVIVKSHTDPFIFTVKGPSGSDRGGSQNLSSDAQWAVKRQWIDSEGSGTESISIDRVTGDLRYGIREGIDSAGQSARALWLTGNCARAPVLKFKF